MKDNGFARVSFKSSVASEVLMCVLRSDEAVVVEEKPSPARGA